MAKIITGRIMDVHRAITSIPAFVAQIHKSIIKIAIMYSNFNSVFYYSLCYVLLV